MGTSDRRYLELLSESFPTVADASAEIINLSAILSLPKGTEIFASDIHGEYEAFSHLLKNGSGSVRLKIDDAFSDFLSQDEKDELATLIYYPREKMKLVFEEVEDTTAWMVTVVDRLIAVAKQASGKYTRSKVRKAFPPQFAYIIDELLHTHWEETDKKEYFENIISTIIDIDQAPGFIEAVCSVIKRMAVDHLHIVGDIFDRGPRADIVMDSLMAHHCVDIQWGNHDVLWMGAAAGSRTCIANVLNNSITYNNLEVVEDVLGSTARFFANECAFRTDARIVELARKLQATAGGTLAKDTDGE